MRAAVAACVWLVCGVVLFGLACGAAGLAGGFAGAPFAAALAGVPGFGSADLSGALPEAVLAGAVLAGAVLAEVVRAEVVRAGAVLAGVAALRRAASPVLPATGSLPVTGALAGTGVLFGAVLAARSFAAVPFVAFRGRDFKVALTATFAFAVGFAGVFVFVDPDFACALRSVEADFALAVRFALTGMS